MNEKRELPILNGKLLSDLDANGHKIIGVDIEFSPKKIKEAIAPELEAKADKSELESKADKDDVWLRGNDATSDTNFAKSIKVNVIEALDDESDIKFGAPIVSNTVSYGGESEPAFAVIDGNMIQAFSHDGDSNSDLVIRGRSFYFQGNSYDYPQSPPAIYTEGDVVCEGEIFTSGLTFRTSDGLDGGSLVWEDYNHMLRTTSACSVEDIDYGEGHAGINFLINTYTADPWSGEQYPTTYSFDCYGDFHVPNAIYTNYLYIDGHIAQNGYYGEDNSGYVQNNIQPAYIGMNTNSSSEFEYANYDVSMTPEGFNLFYSGMYSDGIDWMNRSTAVNLNRDGLFIDGGSDAYDAVDAISLTIGNGLSLDSYGDMLSLLAGDGLNQICTSGSALTLNANGGLYLYDFGSSIYLQPGDGFSSEGSDGSSTSLGPSGISHYTYDENYNRIGADLNSHDFATLREMIEEFRASKGA